MAEENISQEFSLKTIGKTRNYLIEEITRNEWCPENPPLVNSAR